MGTYSYKTSLTRPGIGCFIAVRTHVAPLSVKGLTG